MPAAPTLDMAAPIEETVGGETGLQALPIALEAAAAPEPPPLNGVSDSPTAELEVDLLGPAEPAAISEDLPLAADETPLAVVDDEADAEDEPLFQFCLDEVSEQQISGWIRRSDQPMHRCVVALREGNRILARATASQFRADLTWAGIGDGCHSFVIPIPSALLGGGEHMLEIFEEDTGLPLAPDPIRWGAAPPAPTGNGAGLHDGNGGLFVSHSGWQADAPGIEARADQVDRAVRPLRAPRFPAGDARPGRVAGATSAVVGTTILFDISDLVYYIGEHANLTGIQRVQSSIVLAILANRLYPAAGLVFLSFNPRTRNWVEIPPGFLATLLEDLFLPELQRLVSFPAEEARYGVLPGAREFTGARVLNRSAPSVLCLLGAGWVHQDYVRHVLALKHQFGTKFVMTVHDLIPIYARETCDQDTARVFQEFMQRALRHADHLLSVSENTAADLRRYTASLKIAMPPVTVTQNGSSFAEFLPAASAEDGELKTEELPERFVLFVATIEGRKNHDLMLRIWQRMIADGDDPPHLVCVGRLGWKSSGFITTLVETNYLDGHIHLLRDISDTDLRMLYRRCLFTVCPTFYEGWGLPIGELLAMGKVCISSDRASVPEVAGEFGVYIDIDDLERSLAAIRAMIADAAKRRRLEAKIRRGYRPVTWRAVAERVVEACRDAARIKWQVPYPYTEIPYSSEITFSRLDRSIDGTGELLLTRIANARRGLIRREPLKDQAFAYGEEIRTGGHWAYPEDWGTWACHTGGEIALALPANDSAVYYVILRLRVSGPLVDRPVRISANGNPLWEDRMGPHSRNIVMRVRRQAAKSGTGWQLRLRAQIDLTPDLRNQIAAVDARMPTIGFERLIVVPDDDVKTSLDIIYTMLL